MALSRVSALLLAATYEHPPCALIESGSASWPARPCLKEPELWPEWRPPLPVAAKGLARQQRREAAMRARGIEPPKPRACDPPCRGWAPESFEYIMLDAPCTGLGLRPRLTQELKLADLEGAAAYQRTLIDTAVALLRPSGRLVYSTCSINPGSAPPGKNASGCLHRCSGLSISWSRVLRLMGAVRCSGCRGE